MLSKLDKNIISLVSCDLPLVKKPFKELAESIGIDEKILLERIKSYKKTGFLRKFSGALNHKKIGFKYNAMVVWNISESLIDEAGNLMASFSEISHCYQREKNDDWNYNLYSMVHGRTKAACLDVIKNISKKIKCDDYRILFSSEEYKKTGAKYFTKSRE